MTIQEFLQKHKLPPVYQTIAETYFNPLADKLIDIQQHHTKPTLYIGINGCQGSGKTTLADYLVSQFENKGLSACAVSIDDFYLTKAEREKLSQEQHPLFLTRGVPGTHDVDLAKSTMDALAVSGEVAVPRFNKAIDDRFSQSDWDSKNAPLDIVILEGWCVLIPPQDDDELVEPINDLERHKDKDGKWRSYVNQCLREQYCSLWDKMDYKVMLKAPSFDTIFNWRLEQETKLREKIAQTGGDDSGVMSAEQVHDFISYYERLSTHGIANLPQLCDTVFKLDKNRNISL